MYEQFLKLTGLATMTSTNQIILVSVVLIIATILGFMTDSLLRTAGFGPIGNLVIMILGFVGGAIAYTQYLFVHRYSYPYLPIAAPIIGALSGLLVLAVLKAIFKRN